jgi:hypothetical protein
MDKKKLNVVKKIQRLYIKTFVSNLPGSGGTIQMDVTGKMPEEIYILVCKLEQENIKNQKKFFRVCRNVIYSYHVFEIEQMTDGREKFAHTNKSSEVIVSTIIQPVYVRGEEIPLQDLLLKKELGTLSAKDSKAFSYFISSFRSNIGETKKDIINNYMNEEDSKVIKITGPDRRESFFEKPNKKYSIRSLIAPSEVLK